MADVVLAMEGLRVGYPGRPSVFDNLALTVDRGGVVAVLGPNGRGKTTLLKTIMGILRPAAGTMARSEEPAFVPQNTQVAIDYSVIDIVLMGRARHIHLFGTPGPADYARAHAALERLGIGHFQSRRVTDLSGGERQLVLIARALVSESRLLLMDEPGSALDFKNQGLILSTIRDLAAEGLTIVFTTHSPQHALNAASHVLLMEAPGRHVFGSVDEVLVDTRLDALYGIPVRNFTVEMGGQSVRTIVPIFQ